MSFIIFLKIEKIIKLQALVYISERTFSLKEVRWKKERKKERKKEKEEGDQSPRKAFCGCYE